MIVFPAIDLIGGKVVRLERGDRSRMKVYADDPVAVAQSFARSPSISRAACSRISAIDGGNLFVSAYF